MAHTCDPFEALDRSLQLQPCPKCSAQLRLDQSKRPPGAVWDDVKDAPPLLLLELDELSNAACGGAVLNTGTVQTLCVHAARRTVQLQYRLVAALVMKPKHYATCMLNHESGQWLHFDGMLPWADPDGVPHGSWIHHRPTATSTGRGRGFLVHGAL